MKSFICLLISAAILIPLLASSLACPAPFSTPSVSIEGNKRVPHEAFNVILIANHSLPVSSLIIISNSLALPGAPTGLLAEAGDGNVTLSWQAPTKIKSRDILGYQIYRGTISGGETLLTMVMKDLTYQDLDLINGQTYFYQVSTVSKEGEGSRSNEVYATPVNNTLIPPGTPRNLEVEAGDGKVTLHWDAPLESGSSPITGYSLSRWNSSLGLLSITTKVVTVNGISYVDHDVINGQEYHYQVAAISAAGASASTEEVGVTPIAPENGSDMVKVLVAFGVAAIVVLIGAIWYRRTYQEVWHKKK